LTYFQKFAKLKNIFINSYLRNIALVTFRAFHVSDKKWHNLHPHDKLALQFLSRNITKAMSKSLKLCLYLKKNVSKEAFWVVFVFIK